MAGTMGLEPATSGVTPQAALVDAKPDICITHTPGHMFVSDMLNEELAAS